MIVMAHGLKSYVNGNNQSCKDLVNYLEKENKEVDINNREPFFNQKDNDILSGNVIHSIDNNKKSLKEKEAKFYMLTINPAPYELKHLAKLATDGKDIDHISQMKPRELEKFNNMVKDYAREVMDNYAKGFNKGISGNDLVYFGKVEQQRHFNGQERAVKEGMAISGQIKPGLQTHVHIVVSRMDNTQKMRLSPQATSRGNNKTKLNGQNVTKGIDKDNLSRTCEASFDKKFEYQRDLNHFYDYQKFNKNPVKAIKQISYGIGTITQAINDPEGAAKNLIKGAAISAIDKAIGKPISTNINKVVGSMQNPDSAKDVLVNQVKQMATKILPPGVQAVIKIAEMAKGLTKGFGREHEL